MDNQDTNSQAVSEIIKADGSFGDGFGKLIGDEYAGHSEIKNAGNVQTLVKNHFNLLKKLGAKTEGMIKVPDENASEDEIKAYNKALGVPDDANGYEFEKAQLPEGMSYDENLEKSFKQFCHQNKIGAKQAAGLYKMYNEYQTALHNNITQSEQQSIQQAQEALKKEWGSKYDDNTNLAIKAINTFADDGFKKYLEETRLGNHPAMVKMFANIAAKISEDSFIKGDGGSDNSQESFLKNFYAEPVNQ